MNSDCNVEFGGWPSGEGRSVCVISLSIEDVAKRIGRRVMEDQGLRYVWLRSNSIGDFTIVGDPDGNNTNVQVFVDISCDKESVIDAIEAEVLSRFSSDLNFSFFDENDYNPRISNK